MEGVIIKRHLPVTIAGPFQIEVPDGTDLSKHNSASLASVNLTLDNFLR